MTEDRWTAVFNASPPGMQSAMLKPECGAITLGPDGPNEETVYKPVGWPATGTLVPDAPPLNSQHRER